MGRPLPLAGPLRLGVGAQAAGVALCVALGLLALALAPRIHAPAMLLVLGFGMAARAAAPRLVEGVEGGAAVCTGPLLKVGIALIGLRLTIEDVGELGGPAVLLVLGSVAVTLVGGFLIARRLGRPRDLSAVAATSVAICGASAALAAAAAAPDRPGLQRETALVIIAVSVLSTGVMVVYPLLATALGFTPAQAALLLGAAIHDVAQVGGAGLAMSDQVAAQAIAVKMIRIACLMPAVMLVQALVAPVRTPGSARPAAPPAFLLAFAALAILACLWPAPDALRTAAAWASTVALTVAVAGIGLKTSFAELRSAPPALVGALVGASAVQLGVVLLLIHLFP